MHRFLFDEGCSDYKYYEYRLAEEEKALSQTRDSQTSQSGGTFISTFMLPYPGPNVLLGDTYPCEFEILTWKENKCFN